MILAAVDVVIAPFFRNKVAYLIGRIRARFGGFPVLVYLEEQLQRVKIISPIAGVITTPKLKEKMGAFVCLKTHGELKGCIGHIKGFLPLDETIREMAKQAAFYDPRFAPLDAGEWKETEVEISVLTPMRKIESVEEIEVGMHGLYIEKGLDTGLLLPQVAVEYGWDRATFLRETCLKAGLPPDAWKDGADIYVFTADVFGE